MESRYEFQLGQFIVSYVIDRWCRNNQGEYAPFPAHIWVHHGAADLTVAFQDAPDLLGVIMEAAREDMENYL